MEKLTIKKIMLLAWIIIILLVLTACDNSVYIWDNLSIVKSIESFKLGSSTFSEYDLLQTDDNIKIVVKHGKFQVGDTIRLIKP